MEKDTLELDGKEEGPPQNEDDGPKQEEEIKV